MKKLKSKNKILKAATSGVLIASSISTVATPISAASFPDIENSSHKESILQLLDRGYIKGFPDGMYKPNKHITRGQAAKIIASILKLDTTNIKNPGFSDLKETHQFYPYIAALAEANIIGGFEDGTFRQEATITRGQMSKMLAIGFNLNSEDEHPFTDVSKKSSYAPYIAALFNNGVTTGSSDTTFSPRNHVTRGQLATFVIRAEKTLEKPVEKATINGKIESISANEIVINKQKYAVNGSIAKAITENKTAFINATISLTVVKGEVNSIEALELSSNAPSFNGQGIQIGTLSIPVTVKKLENVTADTIQYHVEKQALTVNNVKATEFLLNNKPYVIASTENVMAPSNAANVTFNGSTIETLISNIDEAVLTKTNATIKNIIATNTRALALNGDFPNVTVASKTTLSGKANIETLRFEHEPNDVVISSDISITKAIVANSTYTLSELTTKFNVTQLKIDTPTTGENTGNGSYTSPGENTGGGSTSNNPDAEIEKQIIVIDDKMNAVVVGEETFTITDQQKQFLSKHKSEIQNIELTTVGEETVIKSLNIKADLFDGSTLNDIQVQQLIVTAPEVANITNVDNLTLKSTNIITNVIAKKIEATGAISTVSNTTATDITINSTAQHVLVNVEAKKLDLQNTTGTVEVRGNVQNIEGGNAGSLVIASLADIVTVGDVGATEIVVNKTTPTTFASLKMMRSLFASNKSESTFTIEFTGDYKDKTLSINREDTVVDVQSSTPFSKVNISGNDTLINSNTRLAEVFVSADVTHITLNANVKSLNFTLTSPTQIASKTAQTVDNLILKTNTTSSTKGWVSLLNITPTNITLNDSPTNLDDDIFHKETPPASHPIFDSSISEYDPDDLKKYGHFKLLVPTSTNKYHVVQVSNNEDINTYLTANSVPSHAIEYNQSNGTESVNLKATTKALVVYEADSAKNILKVSTIDTKNIAPYMLDLNEKTGEVNLISRYDATKPVKDQVKYFYIFNDGKLVYENTAFTGITFNTTNGLNEILFDTKLTNTLTGNGESYITDGYILYRQDIADVKPYFSQMLTTLADKAHKAGDPERIRVLLTTIARENNVTFDSLFLGDYVKAISTNPGKYTNDLTALLDLIEELTPEYQLDIQLSKDDLYLQSLPLASTVTYSVKDIVKVEEAPTAGKILFTPLAEGTTTVRVEDKDGVATLINITVTKDNSGKLVIPEKIEATGKKGYEVIATPTQSGTLLDGNENFRFATKDNETFLLPTKLENSFALVKLSATAPNPIGNILNGYAFTQSANAYTLSEKRVIEPVEIKFADIGLTTVSRLTVKNIGVLSNNDGDGIIIFPRSADSELALFGDVKNITGVNVSSNLTTATFDIATPKHVVDGVTVAKKLSIANDLKLDAITTTTMHPQDSLDIHFTKDGDNVQFFANKAAKVAYVFQDSANKKTLVNVTSTVTDNKLTVADGEIVKHTLNEGTTTVTNIAGSSVRNHGLEIYATETGTSIVTLSNGKQYQFDVTQTGNQFKITHEEVKNVVIDASTLHLKDIKEATSSNTNDRLQVVDKKLVVNLAANGTSKIIVKSNSEPTETTVLYVTKTDTGYEFTPATDIVRTELSATDLGLTTVTNGFGDVSPNARIKVEGNKVFVYGFTEGSRLFRVNDGTNNTAINVSVTTEKVTINGQDVDKLKVSAKPVTHPLTQAAGGTISSDAVRLNGTTLYATGLSLDSSGKTMVEVPVAHVDPTVQAFYTIGLSQHTDTKLLSFDTNATTTFKNSINKADLDFGTLYNPTVSAIAPGTGNNISASVTGDKLLITAKGDDEARVQINESTASDAKAFVYVKRDGDNFTAEIEKTVTATDLSKFSYTGTPTVSFSKENVVRAHVDENLNVDFYALAVGKTAYKVTDGSGKNLFVNVDVALEKISAPDIDPPVYSAKRVTTATVEQKTFSDEVTLIEGDAVRLSADKKTIYANKIGTKSIVKLPDNTFVNYEVIENADGQYELADTPIAKSATITKTQLDLTGTLNISGLNAAIASYSVTDDGIIVYGVTNGKTSMTVSNGSKSVVVNIEVTNSGVTISNPLETSITTGAKLIHTEDANIIRIDGTKVYALSPGVAEILVDNQVHQITVTKTDDQYKIEGPVHISNAVYTATDFGFDTDASMAIEQGYKDSFVVTKVDNKIVAYSKLDAGAKDTTEFVVEASGERTLVNVKDTGVDLIESTFATQTGAIDAVATIDNQTIARQKAGTLYTFKEGHTHAIVDGYLQAIDVTRVDGLLSGAVTPLVLPGSYSTLTETDRNIIEVKANGVYAKDFGDTTVQKGNQVYKVSVKNTEGKVTITETAISSKTLLASAAQLANIETATVFYGNKDAVTISILDKENTKNGVAIYSNATTAQNLAILVTDSTGHKALIDVTIDETGKISDAKFIKKTTTVEITTTDADNNGNLDIETVATANARGVWQGTTLTTYATGTGNAALKFKNGLVNVTTTKDDMNKVTMSTNVLAHEDFTTPLNSITNGAILKPIAKGFYPIDEGNALVHADGKVFNVEVTKENDLYKLKVSNGVPFTQLTLTPLEQYDIIDSNLNGVSVAVDTDKDVSDPADKTTLIIYKDGATVGTSDIVITSGADKTVYHVKADATNVAQPKLSMKALSNEFTGATLATGNSVRLAGDDIYYLAEQVSTLKHNNRLVTLDVKRDVDGYFTATPEYVTATVTEAPTKPLTNYDIDGTTVYAKSTDVANATESVLIAHPADTTGEKAYYTTFKSTQTGNKFAVEIDERKAYQYTPSAFGLTTAITTAENTLDSVATAKIVQDEAGVSKLVIIAGTGTGSTTITLKDDKQKQLVIKASRDSQGNFVVHPQASVNSLLFADMDLAVEKDADDKDILITADNYKEDVISVTTTTTGLNITANKVGETSLQLMKQGSVVGLVNVVVEEVNDKLQVTAKPVSFTTTLNELELHNQNDVKARLNTKKANTYFATQTGQALYGDGANAQFVRVSQVAEKELYQVSSSAHEMKEITATQMNLGDLSSATVATPVVGTAISKDKQKLYVYGLNSGTTDVSVSDGTSSTVIVAINGTSLSTTVAQQAITDTALSTKTWTTTAPTVATVRGGNIYTQEAGAALLETTLNNHKVFMNVVVTRNENRTFKIVPEVVATTKTDWTNVKIIKGAENVVVDGTTLYAQQVGSATVQITTATGVKIYTVNVTENANSTLKIALGQEMTQKTFTPEQLGLSGITLEKPIVNSINGAGVVTADIVNNELVVLAKTSGQAEVTVNEGLTTIHFTVTEEAGELTVKETIAKADLTGAAFSKGDNTIIRFTNDSIYALKTGKAIVKANNQLYNVNVTKENNILLPKVERIEYEFTGAGTITTTDNSAIVIEDNKIIAIDYKTEIVTVDGKTYKISVNEDGTMDVVLFAAGEFDFATSDLNATYDKNFTVQSVNNLTETKVVGSKVEITPLSTVTAAGTDIVTVTKDGQTVQLKATISAVENGFKVTAIELVSKTLNVGDLNGIFAKEVLNTDGTVFNSTKALLKPSNGKLTVYPGTAGKVHFIVRDAEGKQSFFEVDSTPTIADQSFTVQPLVQQVKNDKFGYNPVVLATNGKGAATVDGEALNVTFADINETVFVTSSGNSLYHTVLTKAMTSGDIFTLQDATVLEAKVINGDITDVTDKLHAITHNGKTILYATSVTPQTAYFKDQNGIINKVTVATDYSLTTELLLATDTTMYSKLEFMVNTGDDIVTLHQGRLAIKGAGTGIYKINDTDYMKVTVTGDNANGYSVSTKVLAKRDLSSIADSITVLAPTTGVYMDKLMVYGETAEKVAISVTKDNITSIYTAKENTTAETFTNLKRLEYNLLDALQWTSFDKHTLVAGSQFGEIDKATYSFIPKTANAYGEMVTFTTASGIKKQLNIKVLDNYEISVDPGKDEYSFSSSTSSDGSGNTTFYLTFDMNLTGVEIPIIQSNTGTTPTLTKTLRVSVGANDSYTGTFKIKVPETNPVTWHTFTIDIHKVNDVWQIPLLQSDTATFNYQ